jgi:hypothetical protein
MAGYLQGQAVSAGNFTTCHSIIRIARPGTTAAATADQYHDHYADNPQQTDFKETFHCHTSHFDCLFVSFKTIPAFVCLAGQHDNRRGNKMKNLSFLGWMKIYDKPVIVGEKDSLRNKSIQVPDQIHCSGSGPEWENDPKKCRIVMGHNNRYSYKSL